MYAALADVDDPELTSAIKSLGDNVRLILAPTPTLRGRNKGSQGGSRAKLGRELRAASVHVYHQDRTAGAARSNFVVSCDRWGTPLSVWTGSAAWTTRALCLHSNNGIFVESVPLARIYLDRWYDLLDGPTARLARSARTGTAPAHIRERGMSITVWNTPTRGNGDLRDATRLIRGARQGVLFLTNGRRAVETVMEETLRLSLDNDLFIEGLSWSARGRSGARPKYAYYVNGKRTVLSQPHYGEGIDSTIVLVDPFGPHPVVMTGSHDISLDTSARIDSDLLVIENVPSLAAEYAVHLIGMFDHFRWRASVAAAPGRSVAVGLQPTDAWQQRYFKGSKRREFNFFFGSLSPGL